MARKSKLTDTVTNTICKYIEKGNALSTSAKCAGIGEATFHKWMNYGDPDHSSFKGDKIYIEFRERIVAARARAEAEMVAVIKDVAESRNRGSAETAYKWLRSRNPKEWAERVKVDSTTIQLDLSKCTDDQLNRLSNGEDPAVIAAEVARQNNEKQQ